MTPAREGATDGMEKRPTPTEWESAEDSKRPRRFWLHRHEDESGVSGTGVVAVGVQMPSGKVAMEWLNAANETVDTEDNGWAIYSSIEDAEAVHGHDGRTEIKWLDPDVDPVTEALMHLHMAREGPLSEVDTRIERAERELNPLVSGPDAP